MTEPDKAQLWAILAADHPVLAPAYRAGAAASEARIKALEEALIKTGASLAAAISLLEHGGRKAAASDKMFEIMLEDYRAALSEARALLKEADPC